MNMLTKISKTLSRSLLNNSLQASGTVYQNQARYFADNQQQMSVRDALNSALDEEMARDDRVFIIGEEVAEYQGAYKITRGLLDKYGPMRVKDTPITEMGFTGLSIGAAQAGLKPVLEFMTFNFAMQAIDQIVNSSAKTLYMSAGQISCPMVFRGPNGPAAGVAAQHSQCFSSWYSSIPGLKVISPYDSEDCRGLLKAAIRDPDPVVFLEDELVYNYNFPIKPEHLDKDFVLPIGKAKIQREGKDVTIATFSRMVDLSMQAAEQLQKEGISVEVINLRTLRPLDLDTITKSIKKTHRFVGVSQGFPQCGFSSELVTQACELCFDDLDSPPERVTGYDVPMPYAGNLEQAALPQVEDIIKVCKRQVGK